MVRLGSCVRPAAGSPVRVSAGAPGSGPGFVGRAGTDIREVIADINPILLGWGDYFRTGNASTTFIQVDDCAVRRLHDLMRRPHGRHLRRAQWQTWTREWFEARGLYRLRGTIRYPAPAS